MDQLEEKRYKNFIKAEVHYLDDAKYLEGINIHKDPGNEFVMNWIATSSKSFREKWDMSACKNCCHGGICGDRLKSNCNDFEELK
jgi:hypothetical protein